MAISLIKATYTEQYALERYLTSVFGIGKCMVTVRQNSYHGGQRGTLTNGA